MDDVVQIPRTGGVLRLSNFGALALTRSSSSIAASLPGNRIPAGLDTPTCLLPQPGAVPQGKGYASARPECLTVVGLPGEDAATFIPLDIEPYEPAMDAVQAAAVQAAAANATPRTDALPLGSDSLPPQHSSQPPSPPSTAGSPHATASSPPYLGVVPRPPAGAAPAARRSLGRHPLHLLASPSSGTGSGTHTISAGVPPTPKTPPSALTSPQASIGPSTPAGLDVFAAASPATIDTPHLSGTAASSCASSSSSSAAAAAAAAAAAYNADCCSSSGSSSGGISKSTLAFLDPTKPALRRRLPPLWRATNALYDSPAGADVSPPSLATLTGGGSVSGGIDVPALGYGGAAAVPLPSPSAPPAGGCSAGSACMGGGSVLGSRPSGGGASTTSYG
ncbi:hypothetical protein Agub_g15290, partial [Astrephomene gubernaculifera]